MCDSDDDAPCDNDDADLGGHGERADHNALIQPLLLFLRKGGPRGAPDAVPGTYPETWRSRNLFFDFFEISVQSCK